MATASSHPPKIGNFDIIEKLGQGAMGAVYKARQISLDRMVALKILPPEIAADEQFIERFKREAQTSAKLNHPNIVQGIDVGRDEATQLWYFAMEFIDGASLQKILNQEKTLPEERVLEISLDVARALECAERAGIVHRDIKPDNILVGKDGAVKLADLGLAKRASGEGENAALTQAGKAVGTPFYMSPEQIRGENDQIDIRTDIYALGATMFHLLTGKTPYQGNNAAVIMTQHLTAKLPLAHHANPDVSEPTSRLIASMMAREKEKRPETAAALVEKMEGLRNRSASGGRNTFTGTRKPGRLGTGGPMAPVRDGATGPRVPLRDGTGQRHPVHARENNSKGVLALGGVGVLLLLGTVVFLTSSKGAPPARKTAAEPTAAPAPAPMEPVRKAAEETPEKPAPAALTRDQMAQKEFERIAAFAGHPPEDLDGRIGSLKGYLAEYGSSPAAGQARTLLATLEAQAAQRRAPSPSPGPVAAKPAPATISVAKPVPPEPAAQPAPPKPPEAADDSPEQVYAQIKDVLVKMAPPLKQHQYEAALGILKKEQAKARPAGATQALKQEQADIEALARMRLSALEVLRKRAGEEITVRKGNGTFSGIVVAAADREGLTLKIKGGPELTLSAEQLHVEDVVAHAAAGELKPAESARLKGRAYLADGDLPAAKRLLTEAKEAGAGKTVDLPLYMIKVAEMGEVEALASGVWEKAEKLFEAKKLKEAEAVYQEFGEKFAATELLRRNKTLLGERLDAIALAFKPKFSFRADESMQMFEAGARFNNFPPMEAADPLAPFSNKPAYFKQKTGTDVVYEVHSAQPFTSLRWKGAAMQNMTIEIVDMDGKSVKKGGPYQGGNQWAEFTLEFPPQKHFILRMQNHISTWYFINELEFK
ncbi:MAG: serine/threonine protein kinase [Planctomycetota bacterium]|nr:serine/threonine protein kinase [Planctomycetota bacterium]